MTLIEPIIAANYTTELVGKMKVGEAINIMVIMGYSSQELKKQSVFHIALKDLVNQVKYN